MILSPKIQNGKDDYQYHCSLCVSHRHIFCLCLICTMRARTNKPTTNERCFGVYAKPMVQIQVIQTWTKRKLCDGLKVEKESISLVSLCATSPYILSLSVLQDRRGAAFRTNKPTTNKLPKLGQNDNDAIGWKWKSIERFGSLVLANCLGSLSGAL